MEAPDHCIVFSTVHIGKIHSYLCSINCAIEGTCVKRNMKRAPFFRDALDMVINALDLQSIAINKSRIIANVRFYGTSGGLVHDWYTFGTLTQ